MCVLTPVPPSPSGRRDLGACVCVLTPVPPSPSGQREHGACVCVLTPIPPSPAGRWELGACVCVLTPVPPSPRRPEGPRRLCVATAGPDKFPEALSGAGVPFQPCPRIRQLHSMPTRSEPMERGQDWEAMLRQKIEAVTAAREAAGR